MIPQTHARKIDYNIPTRKPKIFPPALLRKKFNNETHYKNLTQQEPKTTASAVTCSDEIQVFFLNIKCVLFDLPRGVKIKVVQVFKAEPQRTRAVCDARAMRGALAVCTC